jgi:hypothetical protein
MACFIKKSINLKHHKLKEGKMTCSKYGLLTNTTFFDFLHEKLITIVPFSIALLAIYRYADSIVWLLIYLVLIGGHMTHMLFQKCPHCNYYKQGGRWLECLWWR